MGPRRSARRLLLVHAHPDDESIGTGATIARYVAEGAQVALVTCTLGELGEIIPPELAHLGADREDRLGAYRITELAAACAALGLADQRFLGGPGRWRDSGMMGMETNGDPRCFWRADVAQAAGELARVIREVRPQVLVTYDENGFYGHPDHIQAHRVAVAAIHLAARQGPVPGSGNEGTRPWQIAKFYATAVPRSVAVAAGLPYFVPDEQVTTEVDGSAYLPAKTAALRAHATQIAVKGDSEGGVKGDSEAGVKGDSEAGVKGDSEAGVKGDSEGGVTGDSEGGMGRRAGGGGRFALSDGRWQPVSGREFYTLLGSHSGAGPGAVEHDLFAGLDAR